MKLSDALERMAECPDKEERGILAGWAEELETHIENQAEHITNQNAALSKHKQAVWRFKSLHHSLGKKYAKAKEALEISPN